MTTNIELNQMNELLYGMWRLKRNERAPVFLVSDILEQWVATYGDITEPALNQILNDGASIGFFLVRQSLEGVLSYGYNANMFAMNPQTRLIVGDSACLAPCARRRDPKVMGVPSTPSNCCYTMNKGTNIPGCCSSSALGVGFGPFCGETIA